MGMTVMVMDKEKIISLLKEMSDYFRECRTNASLGSKAENHFWELQIAAQDAATLLKRQEVKTGHWVLDDEDTNTWECTECGALQIIIDGTPHDNSWFFCPHCGAKLEGR